MNFQLTEDQRAFAESARSLFADTCGDAQLRDHDQSGAAFMQALWAQCVEMGLHSVVVPETHGGLGLGMTELMGVLQAQGSALALVPVWEHQLAAAALAHFAPAALAARVLPSAVAGGSMLTLSLAALADPRGASLSLTPRGSTWLLQGRVAAVPLGGMARHALLAAACEGHPRLLLLDLQHPALRRVVGMSQHHLEVVDLIADGLELPADAVLAGGAMQWLEPRAIACLAALQLGVSAEQLRRTVDYISERKQFGRPVGSFQLVAGQMADGYIALEALRSVLWQLVYRLDQGLGAWPQALGVRVLACEGAHRTGHMAQHVHGGMGVDVTYPIHRFLYWSRALSTALDGSEAQLARLGDWLAEHDSLGWKYDLPEPALVAVPRGATS